jgi:hypothetical protein
MPVKGFHKPEPMDHRVKVQFTATQSVLIDERAAACGLTTAAYLRELALNDVGILAKPPKPKRTRDATLQLAEIHQLAMQVKKLGVNFNQLARQANTGMVPLSRNEIVYFSNQHQLMLARIAAVFEKLLT